MQEFFGKKYKELMATQDSISIPENIKARRQQELAELNQRIQNFQEVVQNDLAKQQQQLLAPVEKKMRDAIKAVGDEYLPICSTLTLCCLPELVVKMLLRW